MIEFRPATAEDLPSIHRIWWAADPFDAFADNPWFGHVLRTGTMLVATLQDRPVAFAGVRRVGHTTVVSDCFVDPDHQARGIGTGLLSRLLSRESPVMTLASDDPKARSLYSRFGMVPQWECHYVEGEPAPAGSGSMAVIEVDRYPVADSDLPHLREDLRCTFVEAGRGNAAVAFDSIESCTLGGSGDPVQVVTSVLGWMGQRGSPLAKLHLSDRHPVFPILMESGFTITGADMLMAGPGAEVPDPTRVMFNGDILRLTT